MEFLAEDPTYLAGLLAILAAGFFIALRVTQQGKFLVLGSGTLGLLALVLVVEKLWVTDNERIEQTVHGLAAAVSVSDVPAVMSYLAPEVQYVAGESAMPGDDTRAMIERAVSNAKFDFVRVTRLRAHAGGQSRRGTAEFQVVASGSFATLYNPLNFASANSSWSLAFKESAPGVWKVVRITPVYVPGGQGVLPTGNYDNRTVVPPRGDPTLPSPRGRRGVRGRPGRVPTS